MLPVCIAPLRENTSPKMSSQSAGWRARVMSSVKSWRNLRNSNSVMTNVFPMKPGRVWINVVIIWFLLSMALGGCAFSGYIAEGSGGIKGVTGIMHKDIIDCVSGTAKRNLEFYTGAKGSHFAQVHDRNAITLALRFLKVMSCEK